MFNNMNLLHFEHARAERTVYLTRFCFLQLQLLPPHPRLILRPYCTEQDNLKGNSLHSFGPNTYSILRNHMKKTMKSMFVMLHQHIDWLLCHECYKHIACLCGTVSQINGPCMDYSCEGPHKKK